MSKKPHPKKKPAKRAHKKATHAPAGAPRRKPTKQSSKKSSKKLAHRASAAHARGGSGRRGAGASSEDAQAAIGSVFERFAKPQYAQATLYDVMNAVMSSVRDPFSTLAAMMARNEDERLSQNAMRLLFLAADDEGVPEAVRDLAQRSAVDPLNAALRDDAVLDSRKCLIGPLLTLLGAEVPTDEYIACFEDYDAALAENKDIVIEGVSDDLEGLDLFASLSKLDALDVFDEADDPDGDPLESAYTAAAVFCEAERDLGAAAAVLAVAFARANDRCDERALRMLDLASRVVTPAAAWALGTLGRLAGGDAAAQHAMRLARQMIAGGTSARPFDAGRFSRALASHVDGDGTRSLFVCMNRDGKEEAAAVFLLNDLLGIKDAFLLLEDVNGALYDFAHAEDAVTCEIVGLECARELVADALSVHERSGAPVPGRVFLCMAFLGVEPLEARPREVRLDAYEPAGPVGDMRRLSDAALLAGSSVYGEMTFTPDEAYAFVAREWADEDPDTFTATDDDRQRFLSCVPEAERWQLAARIAANLEFEAMAGRADDPVNQAAARVRIELCDAERPLAGIPYAQVIASKSIVMVHGNVSCGCRNQREANERAMVRPPIRE
jgi:hypothetical protein